MKSIKNILLLLILAWQISAWSQPAFRYPERYANISTGVWYRTLTLKQDSSEYSISQLISHLTVVNPVTNKFKLLFSTSYAGALFQQNLDRELNGMTDGKIKGFYYLNEEHLLLNFGISVPYGKNQFNLREARVAEQLYENIFGFGVKRYGEGLDFDAGISTAYRLGNQFIFGGGIGYLIRGSYNFAERSTLQLKPGNEVTLNLGLDFESDSVFIRTDFLFRTFSADKIEQKSFYQQGNQYEWSGYLVFRQHPFTFNFSLKNIFKANNKFFNRFQNFRYEGKKFVSNSFYSQLKTNYNISPAQSLMAKAGFNKFGQGDLQLGDASLFNGGAGIQKKFSENFMLTIEFQYLFGSALDGKLEINGWDGMMTCQIRL
ncbi:hypothetical protein JW964_19480 [candidate division KSB1 bacterium]|nr:hypothetical protein [candidate division KSB1 bacterium]